jgi:hypothetical protein
MVAPPLRPDEAPLVPTIPDCVNGTRRPDAEGRAAWLYSDCHCRCDQGKLLNSQSYDALGRCQFVRIFLETGAEGLGIRSFQNIGGDSRRTDTEVAGRHGSLLLGGQTCRSSRARRCAANEKR